MAIAPDKFYSEVSPTAHSGYSRFVRRHIGPGEHEVLEMCTALGCDSLEDLMASVVPAPLRREKDLALPSFTESNEFLDAGCDEAEALARLKKYAQTNQVWRSYLGLGYSGTITPPVIGRNILENPGWYTQYTPYQPEIAQGRLEALINFQTVICELTAMPIANASLLDEGTAAAEAMSVCFHACKDEARNQFFISSACHPQTISVVATRAEALGVEVVVGGDELLVGAGAELFFGVLFQYPGSLGEVLPLKPRIDAAKKIGARAIVAADLLALTLLQPPGECGADIVVGSAQRFGVPLGYGGPHAAFFATVDEFKRMMPGRLVGVSRDAQGEPALRLSLQTREQHIRREKATSNICTAQVLLAVMAGMYAVYHGPSGLSAIAERVHRAARRLAASLRAAGHKLTNTGFFDTVTITPQAPYTTRVVIAAATNAEINLRVLANGDVAIALDETVTEGDLVKIAEVCGASLLPRELYLQECLSDDVKRTSAFLKQDVFHRYHSESEFLRYVKRLEAKDLSLCHSMIPLGSCTMKLNATAEMLPVSWPEFSMLHPFAPVDQAQGYKMMCSDLEDALAEITGFSAVSLQPNAGSQGEYAGLLVIRAYHRARGDEGRNVCLIPKSAHGTNPASAVMAGFEVVVVECDKDGNIDLSDLRTKAMAFGTSVAALMITYPSTHGVFEETVKEAAEIVHRVGGQVYMDGANLNALVGLVAPAEIGMDVCHINLHKTFCIPHGGGGPGMGPIAVAAHLAPFLPSHPLVKTRDEDVHAIGPISAAPWGSASILPISWMYIAMMGAKGLLQATQVAILNANYIAKRLEAAFPVLYRGKSGFVAHECILDCRAFKDTAGIEVGHIARRLMDYGFHAPTVSWPVTGTIMVEPTESEGKEELDRFCEAMLMIRAEIRKVESGEWARDDNPLLNAPHTAGVVTGDSWSHPYSRQQAAFPAPWSKFNKFWPSVGSIDAAYGDRNLVCSCEPLEAYAK